MLGSKHKEGQRLRVLDGRVAVHGSLERKCLDLHGWCGSNVGKTAGEVKTMAVSVLPDAVNEKLKSRNWGCSSVVTHMLRMHKALIRFPAPQSVTLITSFTVILCMVSSRTDEVSASTLQLTFRKG